MPGRIPKPCRKGGCPKTTVNTHGYCEHHKPAPWKNTRKRPDPHQRGYDHHWRKARRLFLRDEPLCRDCARRGLIVAASVVDHITPHEGDPFRFWDRDNWQPLCKRCHDRKTATETHTPWY